MEGFARIHGSLYILSIDIAVQIVKRVSRKRRKIKSINRFFARTIIRSLDL